MILFASDYFESSFYAIFIQIYKLYDNVLQCIMYDLNKQADSDLPTINQNSAYSYVKDAFEISESKHDESLERVSRRDFGDISDGEIANDSPEAVSRKSTKTSTSCILRTRINSFDDLHSHSCLIKILLKHELELSQAPYFYWSGKFSFLATTILSLHSESKLLTGTSMAFAKWAAFAEVHQCFPLDLKVFLELLDSVIESTVDEDGTVAMPNLLMSAKVLIPSCFGLGPNPNTMSGLISAKNCFNELRSNDQDTIQMFYEAVSQLNPAMLSFIEKLNDHNELEFVKIEILRKTFMIINRMRKLQPLAEYAYVTMADDVIVDAIYRGTKASVFNIGSKKTLRSKSNLIRLNELIKILKISTEDCKDLIKRFGTSFEE